MTIGTVCSGIGAPEVAFGRHGFGSSWCSEIEKFPSAVLAHHYPDVVNLGDFTTDEAIEYMVSNPPDVFVGGTPCQSFSVAGLREGLDDPRGNLTLEFLRVIDKVKPEWVVWENVPGILSIDGGEPLEMFLDGLQELGYVFDIDILDAQEFGVPQRRRRVFVVCHRIDVGLKKKMPIYVPTILQNLCEISQMILGELGGRLTVGSLQSESIDANTVNGLKRMMRLFWQETEENWLKLLNCLGEISPMSQPEAKNLESKSGENTKAENLCAATTDTLFVDMFGETESLLKNSNTQQSWKNTLVGVLKVAKQCITSTGSKQTTESAIYTCAVATLAIAKFTIHLNNSCPTCWNAKSLSLTILKEFTEYARQANSQLFNDPKIHHLWDDFIGEAEDTIKTIGHPGDFSVAKILFEPEGLRWNTQASREMGQEIARAVGGGTEAAGFNFEMWSGECIEASPAKQARRAKDNLVYENHPNDSRVKGPLDVCEQLTARNGTGGGNLPLVQEAGKYWNGEDVASTQDASMLAKQQMMPDKNRFNCVIEPIPIHDQATRHSGKRGSNQDGKGNGLGVGKPGECRTTLTKGDKHAVAFNDYGLQAGMQVRRLTPVECERLQNFPDNWTRIPWRGKSPEQCPDGPRYKAIGNSMAVCVVEFIAERIREEMG